MLKFNLNRYIMRSGRMLTAYEKKYAKKLRQALKEQRRHCIENNFEIIDTLTPVITDLYNEVGEKMYLDQYRLLEGTVTKSIFLNTFKVWLKIYINTVALERVKMINDTTRFRAKQIIEEGFQSRLLFETIVDMLDITGIFGAGRAMTIVRTEIGNINNEAKDRSSEYWKKETGVDLYKIWIHRGAKNPRDWHMAMDNGKAIPKIQPFKVAKPSTGGTEDMARPHDGSPENTINCGCEVIYIAERYARQNNML